MNSLTGKLASGVARLTALGKRTDDPLTSTKAVTKWFDALPGGDAFKCQEAILGEFKRFNETSTQYTKDRLAVLMLLDERSRDVQDTLVRQYLRNPRMSRQVESQLWHAIYGLYWEVARGYHSFVLHFSRGAGQTPHENQIPIATLRALQAFGQLLKWRAIRYLPSGDKLWLRLHNLYKIAESERFNNRSLRAYAADASETTCEAAYLHVLMLHLANSGTLYPKQLELVDSWLLSWQKLVQISNRYDAESHSFSVDLAADHGPRRVRKPDADKPFRFWATGNLVHALGELQTALREGASPAQLGLTDNTRTAECLELIDHLKRQWSPLSSREQRRSVRSAVKRLIDVAHGMNAVVTQLKEISAPATSASLYKSTLSYKEADDMRVYGFVTERTHNNESLMRAPTPSGNADVERWVMQDESTCGYGAVVESRDKDWLRVGALLSLRSIEGETCRLGIIRRLARLNDETSSVGIETLNEPPVLAMLYDTTSSGYTVDGLDNSNAKLPHAGIWLTSADKGDSVIIDPVHFAPGKVVQVHGIEGIQHISLGHPMERSEGWIRVKADIVES